MVSSVVGLDDGNKRRQLRQPSHAHHTKLVHIATSLNNALSMPTTKGSTSSGALAVDHAGSEQQADPFLRMLTPRTSRPMCLSGRVAFFSYTCQDVLRRTRMFAGKELRRATYMSYEYAFPGCAMGDSSSAHVLRAWAIGDSSSAHTQFPCWR